MAKKSFLFFNNNFTRINHKTHLKPFVSYVPCMVHREYFSIIFNAKKCALYSIKYGTIASCFITSATYVRLSFFKDFDLSRLDLDNKHFFNSWTKFAFLARDFNSRWCWIYAEYQYNQTLGWKQVISHWPKMLQLALCENYYIIDMILLMFYILAS